MAAKTKAKLLEELIAEAEELGFVIPSDILLSHARKDIKAALDALKLHIKLKPSDLPIFTLKTPGAVPAPKDKGLVLYSEGWGKPAFAQQIYAGLGVNFPLSPTLGGTGIANAAGSTLTLGAATSITGGGTLGLGGFTGSVPATGTFAMGAGTLTASTTNDVTGAAHTHAITGDPALVGVGTVAGQFLQTSTHAVPPPGHLDAAWSLFYLAGTTGGTTTFAVSNTKTLTLTATDDRNITFPITGTAAIGAGTLTSATINDVTVNGHTHAITASTGLVAAGTAQYQVLTTAANPYPAAWSDFYLKGTTGGTVNFAVTNTKTLTLTAADSYNLTVPATGTAALLATQNVFTTNQKINCNSTTALLVEQDGVKDNVLLVDTTNARVAINNTASSTYSLSVASGPGALTTNFYHTGAYSATGGGVCQLCADDGSNYVTAGKRLGIFNFSGRTYNALQNTVAYVAGFSASDFSGASTFSGYLIFATKTFGAGTNTERMRIDSVGYVGIGVTPTSRFHVVESATAAGITNIVNITATGSGANNDGGSIAYNGKSSTTAATAMGLDQFLWVNATHASRTARRVFNVYDTAIREGLRIEASGTAPMISFYGGAAVARGAALTAQLTTITYTAPVTPDYALQDLIDSSAGACFGFATKDEGNTVLSVVKNLQDRVAQLEARLGSVTGVNLFA